MERISKHIQRIIGWVESEGKLEKEPRIILDHLNELIKFLEEYESHFSQGLIKFQGELLQNEDKDIYQDIKETIRCLKKATDAIIDNMYVLSAPSKEYNRVKEFFITMMQKAWEACEKSADLLRIEEKLAREKLKLLSELEQAL